jgi:MFS family permease
MYSDEDIDIAVHKGVLTPFDAQRFRKMASAQSNVPIVDEELFKFTTGMADFFISGALLILFAAMIILTSKIGLLAGFLIALMGIGLSEFLLGQGKRAVSTVLLCFITYCGLGAGLLGLALPSHFEITSEFWTADNFTHWVSPFSALIALAALGLAMHAYWLRFKATVACALAIVTAFSMPVFLIRMLFAHPAPELITAIALISAIGLLVVAIWWDMSDVYRETKRSDIALWLHLFAAQNISSVCVYMILGFGGRDWPHRAEIQQAYYNFTTSQSAATVALMLAFAFVALMLNRRALLIAGMASLLHAIAGLMGEVGGFGFPAKSALLVSSTMLLAAFFWTPVRRQLLQFIPLSFRAQLPRSEMRDGRVRPID